MNTDFKGKLCGIVTRISLKITFHHQTPKSTIATVIWTVFQITIKLNIIRFY